jgi:Icc-related predicted phosphoesterase
MNLGNDTPLRLAAVGDLHCQEAGMEVFRYAFADVNQRADVLVLCGDLTYRGRMAEIDVVIEELAEVRIPVVAVLGNHDYHEKNQRRFHDRLEEVGVTVLDGDSCTFDVRGHTVGFTGTKGFAGGFGRRALTDFGEDLWRQFYREARREGDKIRDGLRVLDTELKIVILHYSPIIDTLTGEDPQIYPFLGASELAAAIDEGGANLVLHGHAHFGREFGVTAAGVLVHNVSHSLLCQAYRLFELEWPPK